jgi:hypothetical protein
LYSVSIFSIFRHALAIVHFNENIKRDAKKTKDGKVYYSIHYPKYKNGDELVRTVPVPPSYNYVKDLRNMLFKDTKASMKLKILEFLKNVPAPLSSQFSNKVDRLTALDNYHKRQEMTVQLYPSCKCSCYHTIVSHRNRLFDC